MHTHRGRRYITQCICAGSGRVAQASRIAISKWWIFRADRESAWIKGAGRARLCASRSRLLPEPRVSGLGLEGLARRLARAPFEAGLFQVGIDCSAREKSSAACVRGFRGQKFFLPSWLGIESVGEFLFFFFRGRVRIRDFSVVLKNDFF